MNKTLSLSEKVGIFVFISTFSFVWFSAFNDEDLSDEAVSLLNRVDTNGESDAYFYLAGIMAEEGADIINAGKINLDRDQTDADHASYGEKNRHNNGKLEMPRGKEFCGLTLERDCLGYIFSDKAKRSQLLEEHRILVSRFEEFLTFDEFMTLPKPAVQEPMISYAPLFRALRIKVLESISIYQEGKLKQSTEMLTTMISRLRKGLRLQDDLLGKYIFILGVSEVIDILSVILSIENTPHEMIPMLSKSERSIYMLAAREFGWKYDSLANIGTELNIVNRLLLRIVYKPNMSINAITPVYYRLERLAELSPSEFAKSLLVESNQSPSTSKIFNYSGNKLISQETRLDRYIEQLNNLDVKISIFNQLHHLRADGSSLSNPYYGTESPLKSNGKLCLSGPREDKLESRCLMVEI